MAVTARRQEYPAMQVRPLDCSSPFSIPVSQNRARMHSSRRRTQPSFSCVLPASVVRPKAPAPAVRRTRYVCFEATRAAMERATGEERTQSESSLWGNSSPFTLDLSQATVHLMSLLTAGRLVGCARFAWRFFEGLRRPGCTGTRN